MRASLLFPVALGLSLRKSEVVTDMGAEDFWIPFSMGHNKVQYFNPMRSNVSDFVPAGARAATQVAMLEVGATESMTEGCMPKCGWSCGTPNCNQACKPRCNQPVCQTRCKKPDLNDCRVTCAAEQQCSVVCPPEAETPVCREGEQCTDPKCETQCSRPKGCAIQCGAGMDALCHNACAPPKCEWDCKKPEESECPKPECKMVCEPNPKCKPSRTSYALPKLQDNHDVVGEFNADGMGGQWHEGSWSDCQPVIPTGVTNCGIGMQRRAVYCSTGNDADCSGPRPADSQRCHKECSNSELRPFDGGESLGSSSGQGDLIGSSSSGSHDFEDGDDVKGPGPRRTSREQPLDEAALGSSSSSGSSDFEEEERPRKRHRRHSEDTEESAALGLLPTSTVWLFVALVLLLCVVVALFIFCTNKRSRPNAEGPQYGAVERVPQ
mmetsp:Transcript_59296/g.129868  ORF Transcript_59296/g.129868 Transcript_59296/m.129868 type:complete len:437 (+) Transcript_59296:139-1449(+)